MYLIPLFAVVMIVQTLPPPATHGALNPAVTQSNVKQTACKSGWTKTVRPPAAFTNKLKARQIDALGLSGKPKDYEEDHRVPLELGGNPTDEANLWPQPWKGAYNARNKDRLENSVKRDVCAGRLTLAEGRAIFLGDFWTEYQRRFKTPAK